MKRYKSFTDINTLFEPSVRYGTEMKEFYPSAIRLPDDMEFDEVDIPVLTVNKDNPYICDYSTNKVPVMRVYVKHKPSGYTEAQKQSGNGTKANPFLNLEHAFEVVQKFIYNSCTIYAQIIIMPDSSAIDCKITESASDVTQRIVVGAFDKATYFEVADGSRIPCKVLSQAQSATFAKVQLYYNTDIAHYEHELYMYQSAEKKDTAVKFASLRGKPIWIDETSGFIPQEYHVSMTAGYVTADVVYFTETVKTETRSEESRFDYDAENQTADLWIIQNMVFDEKENIIITWKTSNKKTVFKKQGDEWIAENVHLPNMGIYDKCVIKTNNRKSVWWFTAYYTVGIKERTKHNATWYICHTDSNGNWISSGGDVKFNGQTVFTLDLFYKFIEAQDMPPVIFNCSNIVPDSNRVNIISSSIVYSGQQIYCVSNILYDCTVKGNVLTYADLADKCTFENSFTDDEIISRSKGVSVTFYDTYSTQTRNVIYDSEISFTQTAHQIRVVNVIKSKLQGGAASFDVDNLIDSEINVVPIEISPEYAVTVNKLVSDSKVTYAGTIDWTGKGYDDSSFCAVNLVDENVAVSNLETFCDVKIKKDDLDGDTCFYIVNCDLSINEKCASNCRFTAYGKCSSIPDDWEFCK